MNKKSKMFFVCSFALAMLAVTTQQNVKADTTTDAAVENVQQPVAQATQEENNQEATTQEVQAPEATTESTVKTTTDQTPVVNDATTEDATTTPQTQRTVTQIKGIITTGDQLTYLYNQDGQQLTNRALGPNTPWYTDQKVLSNGGTYYRVATNEFADGANTKFSYGNAADGIVRVKQNGAANYTRDESGFYKSAQAGFGANTVWKYNRTDDADGLTYYQISNNVWVNSNDATTAAAYQNPNGWLQIHNEQIKPVGPVGYELYNGVEGIKTWLVRKYFGYSNAHTIYNSAVAASVRSLQARKGLPVTGIVNLDTWKAMGFVEDSWYGLDSYVAPLRTNITSTRADHVEAMINEAYRYMGKPWISGASSTPDFGVDCSGLVTQALYASGIDSAPVSSIQHAQPGNEWNCQMYWNDSRIHRVNFNERQRGDLIFFTDPSSGMLWHVGILLNPTTMIESWPYAVQVHSIYSGRGNIAGVKRVFA